MRYNIHIFLGTDLKPFAVRVKKYSLKYGEGNAPDYLTVFSKVDTDDGRTEILRAVKEHHAQDTFVSTTSDHYATTLQAERMLEAENRAVALRSWLSELFQSTITIDNQSDDSTLHFVLYLPAYDLKCIAQAREIVETLQTIRSNSHVMIVGLCSDLYPVIHTANPEEILDDMALSAPQQEGLLALKDLRLADNSLFQVLLLQNTNKSGFALHFTADSLQRIFGELALICIEKFETIFPYQTTYEKEHPFTGFGLSVLNLDKYYFANYLLRCAYLQVLRREKVSQQSVDVNTVGLIAQNLLIEHRNLFSNFYSTQVEPLVKSGKDKDSIAAQVAPLLQKQIDQITQDLTQHVGRDDLSLPEKQGILAMILGYDDHLLEGNLFQQEQLTLDDLDDEVAQIFIEENNLQNSTVTDSEGNEQQVPGPLGRELHTVLKVELPLQQLKKLRKNIRESTNYIRQKNKELLALGQMQQDAQESERRLTEEGFVFDGHLYHFDVNHEEVHFEDTYQPKPVKAASVDLRPYFTPIKDQGQIGACTVFSVASIFEYIIKKTANKDTDLSESFVYYNVRHATGQENEDTGSSFRDVIQSLGSKGICLESLHPYSEVLNNIPSDEAYADGQTRKVVKAMNVDVEEEAIKSALAEGFPVAISLKVFNSFNATRGFVHRPTEEELHSSEYGHHAMVIVGYTNETRHFVVRNSWGRNFGQDGYCYIPYSYICDRELNRMACIVTEIATTDGTQTVRDVGTKTTVQFDMLDAQIKTYVISNLIEEERLRLDKMKQQDSKLRQEYETLMQTLGRQPVRTELLNGRLARLQTSLTEARKKWHEILKEKLPTKIQEFDKYVRNTKITLILWSIATGLWTIVFLKHKLTPGDHSFFNSTTILVISSILFGLTILLNSLFWPWAIYRKRKLRKALEEEAAIWAVRISNLEKNLNISPIRFHVGGVIIDHLLQLKTTLDKKYQLMKSYIGNLSTWEEEEHKRIGTMESVEKNPFIPVLTNTALDDYFKHNIDSITKDLHLYQFFEDYDLDEKKIVAYKEQLKSKILAQLQSRLDDFHIIRHILSTEQYDYLDREYASPDKLLPLLDKKSEPFLQVNASLSPSPQSRVIFINHTDKEEQHWRQVFPRHFQTEPLSEKIVSPYKIVLFRWLQLTTEEVIES